MQDTTTTNNLALWLHRRKEKKRRRRKRRGSHEEVEGGEQDGVVVPSSSGGAAAAAHREDQHQQLQRWRLADAAPEPQQQQQQPNQHDEGEDGEEGSSRSSNCRDAAGEELVPEVAAAGAASTPGGRRRRERDGGAATAAGGGGGGGDVGGPTSTSGETAGEEVEKLDQHGDDDRDETDDDQQGDDDDLTAASSTSNLLAGESDGHGDFPAPSAAPATAPATAKQEEGKWERERQTPKASPAAAAAAAATPAAADAIGDRDEPLLPGGGDATKPEERLDGYGDEEAIRDIHRGGSEIGGDGSSSPVPTSPPRPAGTDDRSDEEAAEGEEGASVAKAASEQQGRFSPGPEGEGNRQQQQQQQQQEEVHHGRDEDDESLPRRGDDQDVSDAGEEGQEKPPQQQQQESHDQLEQQLLLLQQHRPSEDAAEAAAGAAIADLPSQPSSQELLVLRRQEDPGGAEPGRRDYGANTGMVLRQVAAALSASSFVREGRGRDISTRRWEEQEGIADLRHELRSRRLELQELEERLDWERHMLNRLLLAATAEHQPRIGDENRGICGSPGAAQQQERAVSTAADRVDGLRRECRFVRIGIQRIEERLEREDESFQRHLLREFYDKKTNDDDRNSSNNEDENDASSNRGQRRRHPSDLSTATNDQQRHVGWGLQQHQRKRQRLGRGHDGTGTDEQRRHANHPAAGRAGAWDTAPQPPWTVTANANCSIGRHRQHHDPADPLHRPSYSQGLAATDERSCTTPTGGFAAMSAPQPATAIANSRRFTHHHHHHHHPSQNPAVGSQTRSRATSQYQSQQQAFVTPGVNFNTGNYSTTAEAEAGLTTALGGDATTANAPRSPGTRDARDDDDVAMREEDGASTSSFGWLKADLTAPPTATTVDQEAEKCRVSPQNLRHSPATSTTRVAARAQPPVAIADPTATASSSSSSAKKHNQPLQTKPMEAETADGNKISGSSSIKASTLKSSPPQTATASTGCATSPAKKDTVGQKNTVSTFSKKVDSTATAEKNPTRKLPTQNQADDQGKDRHKQSSPPPTKAGTTARSPTLQREQQQQQQLQDLESNGSDSEEDGRGGETCLLLTPPSSPSMQLPKSPQTLAYQESHNSSKKRDPQGSCTRDTERTSLTTPARDNTTAPPVAPRHGEGHADFTQPPIADDRANGAAVKKSLERQKGAEPGAEAEETLQESFGYGAQSCSLLSPPPSPDAKQDPSQQQPLGKVNQAADSIKKKAAAAAKEDETLQDSFGYGTQTQLLLSPPSPDATQDPHHQQPLGKVKKVTESHKKAPAAVLQDRKEAAESQGSSTSSDLSYTQDPDAIRQATQGPPPSALRKMLSENFNRATASRSPSKTTPARFRSSASSTENVANQNDGGGKSSNRRQALFGKPKKSSKNDPSSPQVAKVAPTDLSRMPPPAPAPAAAVAHSMGPPPPAGKGVASMPNPYAKPSSISTSTATLANFADGRRKQQRREVPPPAPWLSNKPQRDFLEGLGEEDGPGQHHPRRVTMGAQAQRPSASKAKGAEWMMSDRRKSAPAGSSNSSSGKKRRDGVFLDSDDDDGSEPGHCYHEVVRGNKRKLLPCHDCPNCRRFVELLNENSQTDYMQYSRHHAKFAPSETPPGFWELDFADEKKKRDAKREAKRAAWRQLAREGRGACCVTGSQCDDGLSSDSDDEDDDITVHGNAQWP